MATWNPWHGCRKVSSGCLNCYVYRRDAEFGKDSSIIARTSSFALPVKRNRKGIYKLQPDEGAVYTCMTSDFFVEEADEWRPEAWKMKMCIRDSGRDYKSNLPGVFRRSFPVPACEKTYRTGGTQCKP